MSHHTESNEYSINENYFDPSNLSDLGKIFDHSEFGEGFEGMARQISQMSTFERMDFEDLELCGDCVLAPHENTVDMPYYLTVYHYGKNKYRLIYSKTGGINIGHIGGIDTSRNRCKYRTKDKYNNFI